MASTSAHSAQKPLTHKGIAESGWIEGLQTLGLSPTPAFGIRTCVAEARYILSGSMLPTLEINDSLIIDKISYDFRGPHRDDMVVFNSPKTVRQKLSHHVFIKRVIGLPGETISVKNGRVYVNGTLLVEHYLQAAPNYDWGPKTIPQNSYLMLGDKRNDSYDCHFWGFVPRDHIIGRAILRF